MKTDHDDNDDDEVVDVMNFFWGWKRCYKLLGGLARHASPHSPPIRARGVYSDLLYHSHLVATVALPRRFLARDTVERRAAAATSAETFARDFEAPNRPVVLQGCRVAAKVAVRVGGPGDEGTAALREAGDGPVSLDDLEARFADAAVHVSGFTMALREYAAYR
jgi:hypothetical protein